MLLPLTIEEPRLRRLMLRDPLRCASIDEYARACGLSTTDVVNILGFNLDSEDLSFEFAGDQVFLMTAPKGRQNQIKDVPANLWELLRRRNGVEKSYHLFKLLRELEASGWSVEVDSQRLEQEFAEQLHKPAIALKTKGGLIPLLINPNMRVIVDPDGPLTDYDKHRTMALALAVTNQKLDSAVTGVRQWMLTSPNRKSMSIMVLEAPRYNPTVLNPKDGSVAPKDTVRSVLESMDWRSGTW